MKYICWQHVDSDIEVIVKAGNEEQAKELARPLLENMSKTKYARQVVTNSNVTGEINCYPE